MPHVQALTGLSSRWNGTILLSEEVDGFGNPTFAGKKHWDCSILLHRAFLLQPGLFARLIHEALHCVSAGVEPKAYQQFPGWEEGVVEHLTRLLGPGIAAELGWKDAFAARVSYNPELVCLEKLRSVVQREAKPFYVRLLQTPLGRREQTVVQWAIEAHAEIAPARVLARIAADLRGLK